MTQGIRGETRRERHRKAIAQGIQYHHALATFNFHCCINLGGAIRLASNWPFKELLIIGAPPVRSQVRNASGSTVDMIKTTCFRNTNEFLSYVRGKYSLVVLEKTLYSRPLNKDLFPQGEICLLSGNETLGVPEELCLYGDTFHIPTSGPAWSMNTVSALSVGCWELWR